MTSSGPSPLVIPIFIPHAGCPHRCIFCNQTAVTGAGRKIPGADEIGSTVTQWRKYVKDKNRPVQPAFFGGNFLGLERDKLLFLLETAKRLKLDNLIDSVRFSTRPDTISPNTLEILQNHPVKTVELGVQSMDDSVLAKSLRGHTAEDSKKAAALIREAGFELGLQMMPGLPGDSPEKIEYTAQEIIALQPDFVRIYPCTVLKDSPLERLWLKGGYTPLPLSDAVTITKNLWLAFEKRGVKVIRMGLHPSTDPVAEDAIIAGPFHPAFGHLVLSEVFLDMAVEKIKKRNQNHKTSRLAIRVSPKSVSRIRGMKNRNIQILKEKFGIREIHIVEDGGIPEYGMEVEGSGTSPINNYLN